MDNTSLSGLGRGEGHEQQQWTITVDDNIAVLAKESLKRIMFFAVLWIRIQQKEKELMNKTVNSGLFVLLDSSIENGK